MKKVIYTCIIGGYDVLRQPLAIADGWDYVCFCDAPVRCEDGTMAKPGGKWGIWSFRGLPQSIKGRLNLSRYAKMLPHAVLPEYEWSLYHDGNMQIADAGFYDLLNRHINAGDCICHVPHLTRDCIYQEIKTCYLSGHISLGKAISISRRLRKAGYPEHNGLYENGLILRRHNTPEVAAAGDMWWSIFSKGQKRDQLSLIYVYWKLGIRPLFLFDEKTNSRNSELIIYHRHPAKQLNWLQRKWIGSADRIRASIRRRLVRFI